MSCSIGEPFADRATDRFCSSLGVVDPKLSAVVVTEIELSEIPVQVSFAHMEVAAINTAFQDGEEVFDSVGMSVAANVLIHTMSNDFVAGKFGANLTIAASLIGSQMAFAISVFRNNGFYGRGGNVRHIEGPHASIALYQCKNSGFALRPAIASLANVLVPFLAADIGFVGFEEGISPAEWPGVAIVHCEADAVAHVPSGAQSNANGAVKLIAANALLAAAHHDDSLQPEMHRNVAVLEYRADFDSERLAAGIAFVHADPGALAFERPRAVYNTAMRANPSVRPNLATRRRHMRLARRGAGGRRKSSSALSISLPENIELPKWVRQGQYCHSDQYERRSWPYGWGQNPLSINGRVNDGFGA